MAQESSGTAFMEAETILPLVVILAPRGNDDTVAATGPATVVVGQTMVRYPQMDILDVAERAGYKGLLVYVLGAKEYRRMRDEVRE